MKATLLYLGVLFFLGCKKKLNENEQQPKYFFKFKANGESVFFVGDNNGSSLGPVWGETIPVFPSRQLVIHGHEFTGDHNSGMMIIGGDSVEAGRSYLLSNATGGVFEFIFKGKSYRTLTEFGTSRSYDIIANIQSHSDGVLSGSFSGEIATSDLEGYHSLIITEGTFNTKVFYK